MSDFIPLPTRESEKTIRVTLGGESTFMKVDDAVALRKEITAELTRVRSKGLDHDLCRSMYAEGISVSQIARTLGSYDIAVARVIHGPQYGRSPKGAKRVRKLTKRIGK